MATTIPVPIQFSLPEGWVSVNPDEINTPEAAFVALHPGSRGGGFTPNITITGELRDAEVPLNQIAAESVDRLRRGAHEVKLGRTTEGGTAENPVYTQAVRVQVDLGGQPQYLVQYQVFMVFVDTAEPDRRAVLQVVLTSKLDQFPQVIDDFQAFIDSIRPE
ncbi:hypothetical protein [Saccharomonospora sp.]|uniref:hypothetical protein n=1 Tax=Saccharomonospora sp. TaxID=33913 RepID=UPI002627426D|nr:hypothetical protein [Saccharomonospora sp.]